VEGYGHARAPQAEHIDRGNQSAMSIGPFGFDQPEARESTMEFRGSRWL
jgi:hypothetical protein